MSKVWWILLLMIFALPLLAQSPATMPVTGYCTLGGSHAAVSGLNSTNYLQGIIPGCTVTAYLHGTTNLATIYADDNNTPLSNPFTAVMPNSPNSGAWIFWAATGEGYDVVGSGGVAPITYPAPITLTEVFLGGGGGGGGGSCGTGTSPFLMIWDSTNTCGNSTEQDLNSTFQSSATQGAVFAQGVFDNSSVGPQVLDFGVGNDPSVGTARYYLAKVVNNVAYAATTSDTAITLYPVADTLLSNGVAKCSFGTVGAACLQVMQGGRAILTADASGIAANHYFGESTVTGAAIMDLGATPNTAGCLGIADAGAISGGATGTVRMGSCGVVGVGTSIQMKNGGTNYGSPMTGAGSQNCVGCTWSGTAPNFTITATGTGITSETFPADLFSPFTCTGPTCVFGKANAAPGTILRSQASSSYLPITQRGLATTYFNIAGGHVWTIPLAQPASGPDLVEVSVVVNSNASAGAATCSIGDDAVINVLTITDNAGNSYPSAITYGPLLHGFSGIYYAKNVIGATSITVSANATNNACIAAWVTDLFNVDLTSPLDQTAFGFAPVTTLAANEIVLGTYYALGSQHVTTGAPGWPYYVPNTTDSLSDTTVTTVGQVETSTGTFTPQIVDPGGGINVGLTASFKAAAASLGSAPWYFGTADFRLIMWNVFPNLANISPSTTANGDTGMDLHVGQHIWSHDKSIAYPGNDAASTLFSVPASGALGYTCHVYIKCQSAVSTATVIPSIIYTSDDGASTVETIHGGTATCTTLGTSDVVSMVQEVHAALGTTGYLLTALANSPHYDTDAFCELHTTQ